MGDLLLYTAVPASGWEYFVEIFRGKRILEPEGRGGGGGSIWFARRVLFGVVLFVVLSERGLGWLGVFVGLEGWMDG